MRRAICGVHAASVLSIDRDSAMHTATSTSSTVSLRRHEGDTRLHGEAPALNGHDLRTPAPDRALRDRAFPPNSRA